MTDIVKRLRGPTQEFRGLHEEAADVIERLKVLLNEAYADADEVLRPRVADLERLLAESQAREKVLRELLPNVIPNGFITFGKYYAEASAKFLNESDPMSKFKGRYLAECEAALSQPSNNTALKAALAAERERYIKAIQEIANCVEYDGDTADECIQQIKALGD